MSDHTSREEVLEFLKRQFIMNVATISDNKPHSSVLLYTIDDEFTITFATHADTYKAKNLINNPHISLSIWEHGEMLVQADGKAELIEDEAEKLEMVERLAEAAAKDDDFWPPLLRLGGTDYVVFHIKPYWMRALDLTNDTIRAKESPYTDIDF